MDAALRSRFGAVRNIALRVALARPCTATLVRLQSICFDSHAPTRAAGESRDALVADALVDVAPRVRKLAVAAVLRGANPPGLATLQALTASHPQARPSLCSVAARLSPWDRLDYLLGVVRQVDERGTEALLEHLHRWTLDMRNTYVTPTPTQRERLRT